MKGAKKDHLPAFNEPFRGVETLKPIQCKDCVFRDKTSIKLDGKVVRVGATKSVCKMFEYPEIKPMGVLKNTEECDYYEQEKR